MNCTLASITLSAAVTLTAAVVHAAAPFLTLDPASLPYATPADLVPSADYPVPNAFVTLYFENDGTFCRPGGTDKHYTSGQGFSVAAQTSLARDLGRFIPSFADRFDPDHPDTSFAAGFIAYQDIYTPSNLFLTIPDPTDRPYAGLLDLGFFWQRASTPADSSIATMEHLQLDLGLIGPASQADRTQRFIHAHIPTGAVPPQGWGSQLHDEPGVDLIYLRRYRISLTAAHEMWAVQLIPAAGFTVGTFQRNVTVEATLRAGWNLPDDFGPGRMHEVGAFTGRQALPRFGAYGFIRGGGIAVQHNTLLQGNDYRRSAGVTAEPLVGEIQAGLAIQFLRHFELTYSQTLRSEDFRGQQGTDGYGAFVLSFFTTF